MSNQATDLLSKHESGVTMNLGSGKIINLGTFILVRVHLMSYESLSELHLLHFDLLCHLIG